MVQRINVPAFKKQWVLDAQWTDCPPEVVEIVEALWRFHELGNDKYILRYDLNYYQELEDEGFNAEVFKWGEAPEDRIGWIKEPMSLKPLINYVKAAGLADDEEFIIHWWW